MQLCTGAQGSYPMDFMAPLFLPLSVLPRLRRSVALAVLALAIFVLRAGLVTACAPNDLAESLAGESAPFAGLHVEDDASTDPGDLAGGHCLHCSCHYSAAVPVVVLHTAALVGPAPVEVTFAAQANAPPDVSLRPPIA